MNTTLKNLPLRAPTQVKGGLNPQPLPPRIWNPIVNIGLRYIGR